MDSEPRTYTNKHGTASETRYAGRLALSAAYACTYALKGGKEL
jgi:hypothetical protein